MLPFQKEQSCGDLPPQKPSAVGEMQGEGSDHSQDQGYLTVAEHGKRTRKSTAVLAVLFIIGLLCLWFMIKKTTPKAVSAAEAETESAKIEAAISRLTGVKSEVFGRMDEIVNKFYEFSDVFQVQVGELVKNPFKFEVFPTGVEEPEAVEMVSQIDAETLWKQRIRQKGESLELRGIMQTDRGNCCMIGSDIYYEGEAVEGFKVSEIGDSHVKLEWQTKDNGSSSAVPSDSVEIVLKLSN
jgi:preprotein translocase subunit SecG